MALAAMPDGPRVRYEAYYAAQRGNMARVQELLRDHPDKVQVDSEVGHYPSTLAHAAALNDYWDLLKWLLSKKPAMVNFQDYEGCTVLHHAAENCCPVSVMRFLIDMGGDPKASTFSGVTVFHKAVLGDSYQGCQLIKMLLREDGVDINKKNDRGESAIFSAILMQNVTAVELICSDPRLELDVRTDRKSVLHHCFKEVLGRYTEMPRILFCLLSRTNCEVDLVDMDGNTALDLCEGGGLARLLLVAADLGRNSGKQSKTERSKKKRELGQLLERCSQKYF